MAQRRIILWFLTIALGLLAPHAGAQAEPDYSRTPGGVMINIFSGRRDPTFLPSDPDFARVLAMIERLPAGNEDKGLWQNLGYRGFRLHLSDLKAIQVYRDTIEIRTWTTEPRGSTAVYKRDDARTVEIELIRLAEKSGALNKELKVEIESGKDPRTSKKK